MSRRREYLGYISDGQSDKPVAEAITAAEAKLLVEVLKAVRRATRTRHQLSITFDPFIRGDGAHASFTFDASGYQVTIEGRFRR